MIGDVKHKRGAKATAYSAKNSKGRSHKTVAPHKDMSDDDGDAGTHPVARRMTKGMKPGVGSHDKQSARKQVSHKIEAWCEGKADCYK